MQTFPPSELVSCAGLILVTDELPAPADFFLHRFLHSWLKEARQSDCIFLSVSEDIERIKAVAAKAAFNIASYKKFKFVDCSRSLDLLESLSDSGGSRLRHILDSLSSELNDGPLSEGRSLILLDDLASLEWLGFSNLDLSRFVRALKALCSKSSATLVIRQHALNSSEPDSLCQLLLQLCSYHVEVRPLASGRSGAVSGEICLHVGPSENEPTVRLTPRTTALQYRLTDGGAIFFNKGTSEGVL